MEGEGVIVRKVETISGNFPTHKECSCAKYHLGDNIVKVAFSFECILLLIYYTRCYGLFVSPWKLNINWHVIYRPYFFSPHESLKSWNLEGLRDELIRKVSLSWCQAPIQSVNQKLKDCGSSTQRLISISKMIILFCNYPKFQDIVIYYGNRPKICANFFLRTNYKFWNLKFQANNLQPHILSFRTFSG